MNITILCGHPNSSYAREVLRALNAHGLERVSIVAAMEPNASRSWRAIWSTYSWRLPWVLGQRLMRYATIRIMKNLVYESVSYDSLEKEVLVQGGQFLCVPGINSEAGRRAVLSLSTDLMILAGAPIVRKPLLEVPHLGVLNAHQGALPQFRGMNVIEWAVLEKTQPTLSVHFVDSGVDTGDIVRTIPVPIMTGDTLDAVRTRASARQPELLAQTAVALLTASLPRKPQRPEDGRQYYVMHPRLREVAERRLQECSLGKDRTVVDLSSERDIADEKPSSYGILVRRAS